jgi:SAM-dependent methyltransferase
MNYSTLLAFHTYFRSQAATVDAEIYWHPEQEFVAIELQRMLDVWPERVHATPMGPALPLDTRIRRGNKTIIYASDIENAATAAQGANVIVATLPDTNDPLFGFWNEICAHDFGLGGVNEWSGEDDQFCAPVLQTISMVHSHRIFPRFASQQFNELLSTRKKIVALDIGCGPISRLRAYALLDKMTITGVDPLNDLYDAILARHGLTCLPKIRPDETLQGFAETLMLDGRTFDLVFSYNALDHTQDIERAFSLIRKALSPDGIAVICMYGKEGERQNYKGLHKYNVWLDSGTIRVSENTGRERDLLASVGGLHLESVLFEIQDGLFSVVLRRA